YIERRPCARATMKSFAPTQKLRLRAQRGVFVDGWLSKERSKAGRHQHSIKGSVRVAKHVHPMGSTKPWSLKVQTVFGRSCDGSPTERIQSWCAARVAPMWSRWRDSTLMG